jgi:hypothetical protein
MQLRMTIGNLVMSMIEENAEESLLVAKVKRTRSHQVLTLCIRESKTHQDTHISVVVFVAAALIAVRTINFLSLGFGTWLFFTFKVLAPSK